MNSLIYVLTAVSALTGQLYSNPACNGPGCQSNSASGSSRSLLTSRQIDARQYSQFGDPLLTAACQCRTCDPRIPCSPENCARQDCAECVDGCQNCIADRLARPVNDGWEPRAGSRQSSRPSQATAQRLCPVTGEELGSMGPPIPVTISGRTIQVCCEACVTAVRRSPEKYFQRVAEELRMVPTDSSRGSFSRPQSVRQTRVQRLCPVTGEELGSMGPPIPVTISGRTIQVCCEACVTAVRRSPAKYFAKVEDELNSASGRPMSGRLTSGSILR